MGVKYKVSTTFLEKIGIFQLRNGRSVKHSLKNCVMILSYLVISDEKSTSVPSDESDSNEHGLQELKASSDKGH